jgi:Zn-dependent protease with chaperone function
MAVTASSLPGEGYRLTDISPRAFQHPADKGATAALGSIPYLDTVVRKLIELGYERALRQSYLGSSVRLSEQQLGDVYREHAIAYATLDMADVPDLYLTQYPAPNALAIGASKPIVVVQSELVQLLDAPQRRAVFAHEAAHILSDHQLYRTALAILVLMTRSARLPLPLAPVRSALMEWGRATELSADRAAALVTRDPLVVCRTLMSLAAGAMVDQLDLDLFMRQGMDYQEQGGGLERLTRLMLDLGVTHPLPVKRTHELMAWVRSGEYERIVGGEYARRGDPVDARADGGEAVSFYAERIRDGFRDAGESINSVGKQLAGWLRRDGDADEDDDADFGADEGETESGAPLGGEEPAP